MNTPNLDELINQAAEADRSSYEGARIRTQFARLFATHGPALVAVLKDLLKTSQSASGDYVFARSDALKLLTQLDQEATCQK